TLFQDGLRIAARSERAVDMRLARGGGERGDDFVEEDGNVGLGGRGRAHSVIPFSSSRYSASSRRSRSPLSSACFGFQISNVPPTPTNRARSSIPPRRRIIGG